MFPKVPGQTCISSHTAGLHGGWGEGLQRMLGKQNEQKMARAAGWLPGAHGTLLLLGVSLISCGVCLPKKVFVSSSVYFIID